MGGVKRKKLLNSLWVWLGLRGRPGQTALMIPTPPWVMRLWWRLCRSASSSLDMRRLIRFRRRSRGKEETFLEFGHRLRRLAIRAFPKINFEAREELVVDQFLLGLPDAEMRRHVSLAHAGNVDQAITLATEYETVSQSMKGIVPSKPKQVAAVQGTGTSSQDSSNTEDLLKVLIDLVKKQNRSGPGTRCGGPQWASPIICFKCSHPGHIARDCPPLQTEQTTPGEENQNGKKSPLN